MNSSPGADIKLSLSCLTLLLAMAGCTEMNDASGVNERGPSKFALADSVAEDAVALDTNQPNQDDILPLEDWVHTQDMVEEPDTSTPLTTDVYGDVGQPIGGDRPGDKNDGPGDNGDQGGGAGDQGGDQGGDGGDQGGDGGDQGGDGGDKGGGAGDQGGEQGGDGGDKGGGAGGQDGGDQEEKVQGCDPEAPGTGLAQASAPSFSVVVSPPTIAFGDLSNKGHVHYPDGAVSLVQTPAGWEAFLPVGNSTFRLAGGSIANLSVNPGGPVIAPTGSVNDPHHGYAGATSVFDCAGLRTAFFHSEYHNIPVAKTPDGPLPYHATMGRATSGDGANFAVDGQPWVLTSSGSKPFQAPKIAYGAGGGSIFDPGGDYIYMYYFDWNGSPGTHVARACKASCGAPGAWRKWNGSAFAEDALGNAFLEPSGNSAAIIPVGAGSFDAFNVVSYNTYLGAYLIASATEKGIALRASADGINWGPRVRVLKHITPFDATIRVLYPSAFDANTWSRNQTGRYLKIFYGAEMTPAGQKTAHRAYVLDLELSTGGAAKSVTWDRRKLVRHYDPSGSGDHWVTTGQAPGYVSEGGLGKLASNSIPGTRPLYDCVLGSNHIASNLSSCEGGTSLGIMGYIWGGPGPNRHPVYRCWVLSPAGGIDHFVSVDAGCEGQNSDGVLGYVE